MKLLVLSDSHGRASYIEKAIEKHPDARHIFFLGDNISDIEDYDLIYPERLFYKVAGNCDFASLSKCSDTALIENTKIIYCHGHTYNVKSGTDYLVATALQNDCKIALYGHTHIPDIAYKNGIYVINPGTLSGCRTGLCTYCVIDINGDKIYPFMEKI